MNDETVGAFLAVWGIVMILVVVVSVVIWWKIFSKAGHAGWMGILMLVPLVNLVLLLMLAFGEWPIHRELEQLRQRAG